jgi:hypothetical protein
LRSVSKGRKSERQFSFEEKGPEVFSVKVSYPPLNRRTIRPVPPIRLKTTADEDDEFPLIRRTVFMSPLNRRTITNFYLSTPLSSCS